MTNQLIWEKNGIVSKYFGKMTSSTHNNSLDNIFGDPRIDSVHYIIADYSKADASLIGKDEADYSIALSLGADQYLKNIKVAFIALDFRNIMLCEYYIQSLSELNSSWIVKIFNDIDSARLWINKLSQH